MWHRQNKHRASEINQTTKNGFGQTFDTESDTVGGGVKVLATNSQGSSAKNCFTLFPFLSSGFKSRKRVGTTLVIENTLPLLYRHVQCTYSPEALVPALKIKNNLS